MEVRNKKFFRLWIGPFRPLIFVYHPEVAKLILKTSAPKSRGFGQLYELVKPWLGESLLLAEGKALKRAKRLLTPAFHSDVLRHYMEVYKAAVRLFEKLDKLAATGESFDMCPLMALCTLEVIMKCAMSYDINCQQMGQHPYAKAVKELTVSWNLRARTLWMWPEFIFRLTSIGRQFFKNCDYVHVVAETVIQQRKDQLEMERAPKKRRLDFLDILLTARDENGKLMTDLEIRNEVVTFMFAGHDTTAIGLPWFLHCLAKNPMYQVKVQEEIDSVLAGRDSDNIEWSDLNNLETVGLCLKESMRLFPPVPMIQRALAEDLIIDGKTLRTGTIVTIAMIHLHKIPDIWEEPEQFLPDRFKHENLKEKDPFS